MTKYYLVILFLIFPIIAYTQLIDRRDTIGYVAILKHDVGYGNLNNSCWINYTNNSSHKDVVVITGYKECINNGLTKAFYSFSNNGIEYFADTMNFLFGEKNIFLSKYISWTVTEKDLYNARALSFANNIPIIQKGIALDKLKTYEKYGLGIISGNAFDESEYTEGTGYSIRFYNPTKKTIKYIWITVAGFNPVDDIVIDPITRRSAKKFTCVGPIEGNETGTYEFNYAWHTDLVESTKIITLKIQYADGSIKNIAKPSLLYLDDETIDYFFK